ncbi:hypothetical protein SDC9_161733 [bioreactor metagenome]|uniref:Uncharacterized protein n=1 Tax=bioreactor metagenome TaxID=1076179 RepID=A0A645FL55_9ZZZZ
MLVDFDSFDGGKVDLIAGFSHSHRQFHPFLISHILKKDGHRPRAHLIIGDRPVRVAIDDKTDFFFRQCFAFLFLDN